MNKGQVGNVQGFVMAIIGVAVVLAIGLIVVTELKFSTIAGGSGSVVNATHYCSGASGAWNGTECTAGTATALPDAYSATGTIITKLATIPTWIGILITVALAFIVLGYFYSRRE